MSQQEARRRHGVVHHRRHHSAERSWNGRASMAGSNRPRIACSTSCRRAKREGQRRGLELEHSKSSSRQPPLSANLPSVGPSDALMCVKHHPKQCLELRFRHVDSPKAAQDATELAKARVPRNSRPLELKNSRSVGKLFVLLISSCGKRSQSQEVEILNISSTFWEAQNKVENLSCILVSSAFLFSTSTQCCS